MRGGGYAWVFSFTFYDLSNTFKSIFVVIYLASRSVASGELFRSLVCHGQEVKVSVWFLTSPSHDTEESLTHKT